MPPASGTWEGGFPSLQQERVRLEEEMDSVLPPPAPDSPKACVCPPFLPPLLSPHSFGLQASRIWGKVNKTSPHRAEPHQGPPQRSHLSSPGRGASGESVGTREFPNLASEQPPREEKDRPATHDAV